MTNIKRVTILRIVNEPTGKGLANYLFWWENPTMSATVVREKRQTTLPADVVEAAGIRVNDQVDWRFEDGEIRGRKLVPAARKGGRLKIVKKSGFLMLEGPLDRQEIIAAIRADRDGK